MSYTTEEIQNAALRHPGAAKYLRDLLEEQTSLQKRLEAAEAIVNPLNELRAPEGNTVLFVCDNPDFNDNPDAIIEVNGERFGGKNIAECLQKAVTEHRQQKLCLKQPPDMLLFVASSKRSFRCEGCGCNVFRRDRPGHYICNGCGEGYSAEPARP